LSEKKRRNDDRQVKQNRSKGRNKELVERVENSHGQSSQADEKNIGKHDPVEDSRQLPFARDFSKTRRDNPDQPRRKNHAQNHEDSHDHGQVIEEGVGKFPQLLF